MEAEELMAQLGVEEPVEEEVKAGEDGAAEPDKAELERRKLQSERDKSAAELKKEREQRGHLEARLSKLEQALPPAAVDDSPEAKAVVEIKTLGVYADYKRLDKAVADEDMTEEEAVAEMAKIIKEAKAQKRLDELDNKLESQATTRKHEIAEREFKLTFNELVTDEDEAAQAKIRKATGLILKNDEGIDPSDPKTYADIKPETLKRRIRQAQSEAKELLAKHDKPGRKEADLEDGKGKSPPSNDKINYGKLSDKEVMALTLGRNP